VDTIPHRLLGQARTRPDAPAWHHKTDGEWRTSTWAEVVAECRRAARALIALGLRPGDKVCILGWNRPEWVVADHAAMLAGGAAAGIYTTCSAEEVCYIVDHSEAPVVFVENAEQWRKIEARRAGLPKLRQVVLFRGATVDDPLVLGWDAFLDRGEAVPDAAVDERLAGLGSATTTSPSSSTRGAPPVRRRR
jgi:long-chain acyl-CoA synthetase